MPTTRIKISGPVFDGTAVQAVSAFTDTLAAEVAAVGVTMIKVEASSFDKSGRGGTGEAAGGVELGGSNSRYTISGGIREGRYAWPWLEGTSQRNQGNKFKGYKTFRRTRGRLKKAGTIYAQQLLDDLLAELGGE
jgi:hypothetical protein